MKIALLAPFGLQPKGSVQARVIPLSYSLAERGHMVRVVIPPWDDPSYSRGSKRHESVWVAPSGAGGVHTVTLALPRRAPYSLALSDGLVREAVRPGVPRASGTSNIEQELARFVADIVHVFKPVGYSGLSGFMLSGLGVPWVLDVDDWEGPGGWADVNRYSPAERLLTTFMEASLPRLAGAVTAASKTLEARAWNMGLPREHVVYLPNAIGTDKYAAWIAPEDMVKRARLTATLGLGDAPVVLLYTRFDVFPVEWPLQIMKQVLAVQPQARLLVVGQGFAREERTMQQGAERLGIADRLILTGYVQGADLPAYLRLADVCIYPMRDTLLNRAKSPMKALEPMLLGLPMVAHRVGEVTHYLGDAGVLVPPGSLQQMARAVLDLLADPARRKLLGDRARRRALDEHSWEVGAAEAEWAYRVVLETRLGNTSAAFSRG